MEEQSDIDRMAEEGGRDPAAGEARSVAAKREVWRGDRIKLVRIDRQSVLDMFRMEEFDILRRPVFEGLPTDVRILQVYENHSCRTFDFIVEHPSFSLVTPGAKAPAIAGKIMYVRFKDTRRVVETQIEEGL